MRFIHLFVVATLVAAAVHVYKIKFESTVQAERVARLRTEIRHERDMIAALRAEWAQLDNPGRIQALAQRHLPLKPVEPTQIEPLDHIPIRPAPPTPAEQPAPQPDAVANMIDGFTSVPTDPASTGGISTGHAAAIGAASVDANSGAGGAAPAGLAPIEIAPVQTVPIPPAPGRDGR